MIEPNAYLGSAHPIEGSELARLYWCTATPMDELAARFGTLADKCHLYRKAGKALLDIKCIDCGERSTATSRQNAVSTIQFRSTHRCDTCRRAHQIKAFEEQRQRGLEKIRRAEELRWMPYPEFLGTDEWAKRRRDALVRAEFKCQVCASGGKLHVHHRTYARRGSERPADLTALCADCHRIFHENGRLAQSGRAD